MQELQEHITYCPYCGEQLEVFIDCSIPHQNYIEDCQVCCRPIVFVVAIDDDSYVTVEVRTENE